MNTLNRGDADSGVAILISTDHNYRTHAMPYYIYKIIPGETATARTLEYTGEHDSYREAKNEVKTLRTAQPKDADLVYKIIFAGNQPEAEQLLLEHREKPILKEWEI
jgi:hypothetical protein